MGKTSKTKKMNIQYSSHLEGIVDLNESFDKGIMRVAYSGLNRNNSFISKKTFENCIKTLQYVPVVANYKVETQKIGSHDSEYQENQDGELQEYVLTMPLGLVPENFKWFWEEVQEKDGKVHEYLCVEVLLWKRQPVYEHIKEVGITDQSMEISVNEGNFTNGYYDITDFTFTALCLLESAEPCFESASLHTYTAIDFKTQYSQMFEEFKLCFTNHSSESDEDINKNNYEKEEKNLDKKLELIQSYGFKVEELGFNYEEFDLDVLTTKLEQFKASKEDITDNSDEFSLSSQLGEALYEAISTEKIETEYGVYSKYSLVDFDTETTEVYTYDRTDYKLYGFTYSVSGDVVTVDYDSKKKKKFTIVDFVEGEDTKEFSLENYTKEIADSAITVATNIADEKYAKEKTELETKINEFEESNSSLQEFKTKYELAQKEEILNSEKYSVLSENKDFVELKANVEKYSIDEIERECKVIFADHVLLVGEFSLNEDSKANRLNIPMNQPEENRPYGGHFDKYIKNTNN